ncbi:hypothetical protein KSP39_PZI012641 [Platanthera zijinensis]|uniref:Uncharacterized protein n=1 Tax=Platanthera zijinensis TaxID=2320716 RepID=A0AAP0BE81_9ASPA
MTLSDSWEWEPRIGSVLHEAFFRSLSRIDPQVQELRAYFEPTGGGTGSTGLASVTLGLLCGCGSVSSAIKLTARTSSRDEGSKPTIGGRRIPFTCSTAKKKHFFLECGTKRRRGEGTRGEASWPGAGLGVEGKQSVPIPLSGFPGASGSAGQEVLEGVPVEILPQKWEEVLNHPFYCAGVVHIPGEIVEPSTISKLTNLNHFLINMKYYFYNEVMQPGYIQSLQWELDQTPAELLPEEDCDKVLEGAFEGRLEGAPSLVWNVEQVSDSRPGFGSFKSFFFSKRRSEKNQNLPTRTISPFVYKYSFYSNSTYCSGSPLTRKIRRKRIELPTHYSEVNHRTLKAVVSYGPHIGSSKLHLLLISLPGREWLEAFDDLKHHGRCWPFRYVHCY